MGMLFNTGETTRLRQQLDAAFSGAGMSMLRTNPPAGFSTANLGTAYGRPIFDYICKPLKITSRHPRRWAFWLGLLDSTVDKSGQYYLSYLIGNAIGDAIHNGNYDAVEFFPVPSSTVSLSIDISDIPDPANNNQLIKVVTIYTALVDSFPHAPPHNT